MYRRQVYSVMALTPAFTSTAAAATTVASTTTPTSGPQIFFEPASFLPAARRTASSPLLPTVIHEYTNCPSYTPYTNSDDDADTEADNTTGGHNVFLARWRSKLGMRSRTAALKAINTGHGTETEDEPVSSILLLFCAHIDHVFRFQTCQPLDFQNQRYQNKIPCIYRNLLPSSFTPCVCWRPSPLFLAPSSICITLYTLRCVQNSTIAPVPTISLPRPGYVSVVRDPTRTQQSLAEYLDWRAMSLLHDWSTYPLEGLLPPPTNPHSFTRTPSNLLARHPLYARFPPV